jgi:hypothetical protein
MMYGLNNLGKQVLLGEREFDMAPVGGKVRTAISIILTGGEIVANKLNLRCSCIPEKEYAANGLDKIAPPRPV